MENWKASKYQGYAASDQGQVYSWIRGKYLKPKEYEEYLKVKVAGKWRFTHVIVNEAFHGPKPKGKETLHLDGNPRNNSAGNLKWGTRAENIQMSKITRLSRKQVTTILESVATNQELAKQFKISSGHVASIKARRTWKNVQYQTSLL